MEHTEWISHGDRFVLDAGKPITYEEEGIGVDLRQPLPGIESIMDAQFRSQEESFGTLKLPCVMVIPKLVEHVDSRTQMGTFPTYCFSPDSPIVRAATGYLGRQIIYNATIQLQGKLLARSVAVRLGKLRVLELKIDAIDGIPNAAPELVPDSQVRKETKPQRVKAGPNVVPPKPVVTPEAEFPGEAPHTGMNGNATVGFVVGTDGMVYDPHIVKATGPDFAVQALKAVAHYKFKPAMMDGKPVETNMNIEVRFKGP